MIGLPTSVISSTSSRSTTASRASSAVSLARQPRTTFVSSLSPPGFIITYETRLMRSSPKRICGFIAPAEASTSPVRRSQRCPATVVEPTSNAIPYAASWKPGQSAVTCVPSWTATVTLHAFAPCNTVSLARSERCSVGRTCASNPRPVNSHSRSSASRRRVRSLAGRARSGSATSTRYSRTTGSTSIGCASASLRTTWRYTWLSGGTSMTTSPASRAVQPSRLPVASDRPAA